MSGGELFDRLVEADYDFTEDDCRTYMRQVCEGVKHIHNNNILHLDLKVTVLFNAVEVQPLNEDLIKSFYVIGII